jgi:Protein of unknown function (DUF2806)
MNNNKAIAIAQLQIKKGDEFQSICDKFLMKLYKDYTTIKAGGNTGDLKNDGYCTESRIFFQCYAPDPNSLTNEEAKNKVIKSKITEDFEGCKAKWSNVKEWIFLCNSRNINADIAKHIDEIRVKNPEISINGYSCEQIWDSYLIGLNEAQLTDIFGIQFESQITRPEMHSAIEMYLDNKIKYVIDPKIDSKIDLKLIGYLKQEQIEEIENLQAVSNFSQDSLNKNLDYDKIDKTNFKLLTDHAKIIYDQDLQKILGAIISGELNSPKSVNPSTIYVLKKLSKKDLDLFARYCGITFLSKYFIEEFFTGDFIKFGYNFEEEFLRLVDLGLIKGVNMSITIIPENLDENTNYVGVKFTRKDVNIKTKISFDSYRITSEGMEIKKYLSIKYDNNFVNNWLIQYLDKIGIIHLLTT